MYYSKKERKCFPPLYLMCKFSSNLGQNRYIMCSPFCNTLLLSVCAVLFSFVCMCSSTELAVASTKLKHQFAFYPLYYAQVQYRPGDDDGFFPHLPERWGEGSTIHSPPALGDQLAHTNSTFFLPGSVQSVSAS